MEQGPAHNTRKLAANRQGTKEKQDERPTAFQVQISENALDCDHAKLDSARVYKIKERARRLSTSEKIKGSGKIDNLDKPTTPKGSRKRRISVKQTTPVKENNRCDIRRFMLEQPQDMASISEVISEANSTLQAEGTENSYTPEKVPRSPDMTIVNMGENAPENTKGKDEDNEVTFKGNEGNTTSKHDQQPQPENQSKEQEPDLENITNAQMMKMLLTTMRQHKEEIKQSMEQQQRTTDEKIEKVKVSVRTNSEAITALKQNETSCTEKHCTKDIRIDQLEHQVKLLTNTVVKHDALVEELQSRNDQSDLREMRSNLIVRGIKESKSENCVSVMNNFFLQTMKITGGVNILKAHRLGGGVDRPMLVYLKSPTEKGKVYKNVRNLKNVKNEKGKSYQIKDQMPGKRADQTTRNRDIMRENSSHTHTAEQLELSLEKGILSIGEIPYKKLVTPPTVKDILQAKDNDRKRWQKIKTVEGNVILKNKCRFHGYSVIAGKIETVKDAYNKLREIHGDARHIMCAYRLPGRNFALLQDYCDDQEHFSGRALLKMLKDADIYNRAVFVVRYYGGEHLGPSRHQAIVEAAQSAITHHPYNHITKENQTPWPKNANENQNPRKNSSNREEATLTEPQITPNAVLPSNSVPMMATGDDQINSQQQDLATLTAQWSENRTSSRGNYNNYRGRQPSGPTRPLANIHNKHYVPDSWNEYYEKEYGKYNGATGGWDQSMEYGTGQQMGTLTENIGNLTQSLRMEAV